MNSFRISLHFEKKLGKNRPLPNSINSRVAKNSELKGAHFEIFQGFSSNFAKNVRFLYYREANKKRHVPLKVAPMCSKAHTINHSGHMPRPSRD